ncbi:MAG: TetR/AcrR family transcriptional regulator [Pelagimonas sp.]|nr:TetR/AcrR family transcriptional regulator [Pelagimonas sp.]
MSDWTSLTPTPAEIREHKLKSIVAVALPLFARHGTAQTTLDRIAAEIGISKAALYRYIPNKADLEARCLSALSKSALGDFSKGADRGRTGLEKLQFGLTEMIGRQLRQYGSADAIFSQLMPRSQITQDGAPLVTRLRTVVELGIADGSIMRADSKRSIAMLIGGLWAIVTVTPIRAGEAPEALAEAAVEQVLRGMDAWPKPSLTAQEQGSPLVLERRDRVQSFEMATARDV